MSFTCVNVIDHVFNVPESSGLRSWMRSVQIPSIGAVLERRDLLLGRKVPVKGACGGDGGWVPRR